MKGGQAHHSLRFGSQRHEGLRRLDAAANAGLEATRVPSSGDGGTKEVVPSLDRARGVALGPHFRCRVNGYIPVVTVSRLLLR